MDRLDSPDKPLRIFDCFFIVQFGANGAHERTMTFPSQGVDEKELQHCQKFCFPFDLSDPKAFGQKHQHFTFMLTDIDKRRKYGFCKLVDSGKQCYCFLSSFKWFEIFYKCLNCMRSIHCRNDMNTLRSLVQKLHLTNVPRPNEIVTISTSLTFSTPAHSSLPSIPENRNMMEYFSSVTTKNMMEIFAALMFERRIIFTSSSLSALTGCIYAAESLLYPLSWQHVFIPVLHQHIIDYCAAPMPFIIGVHSSLFANIQNTTVIDGVVTVDIDSNVVETDYDDLHSMPPEPTSYLRAQLTKPNIPVGKNLSEAFLKTQARLIGIYRHALKFRMGETITFDDDKFIELHKPGSRRNFAEVLVQLQTFRQFIERRLQTLNDGVGFHDAFENEVTGLQLEGENYGTLYKEWLTVARKGGVFINNVKRHAKSNIKFARESARQSVQDMKDAMKPAPKGSLSRMHSLREPVRSLRPPRPPPPRKEHVKTVTRFKMIDEYENQGEPRHDAQAEVNSQKPENEGLLIDFSVDAPLTPVGDGADLNAKGDGSDLADLIAISPTETQRGDLVTTESDIRQTNEQNPLILLNEKVSINHAARRQTSNESLLQPSLISFD